MEGEEFPVRFDRTGSIFDLIDFPAKYRQDLFYHKQLQRPHWIGPAEGVVAGLLEQGDEEWPDLQSYRKKPVLRVRDVIDAGALSMLQELPKKYPIVWRKYKTTFGSTKPVRISTRTAYLDKLGDVPIKWTREAVRQYPGIGQLQAEFPNWRQVLIYVPDEEKIYRIHARGLEEITDPKRIESEFLRGLSRQNTVERFVEQRRRPERPVRVTQRSRGLLQQLDADTQEMIQVIGQAARERQPVRIRYRPKVTTGLPVYRTVYPYSLRVRSVHVHGYDQPPEPTVVFFGYDPFKGSIKMFVADRIITVERKPGEYSPQWPVEFASVMDRVVANLVEQEVEKTYRVYIAKYYFPKESWASGIADDVFEWWNVRASSRREAAEKAWAEHGERLLALMGTRHTQLPRKVSLHVSSPGAGSGGFAGRLTPMHVYTGESVQFVEQEDRVGLCYQLTGRWMLDDHLGYPDARLIHGHLRNPFKQGLPELDHAWIVAGDKVWEPTADKWYEKDLFYQLFNAEEYYSYTWEEMSKLMLRHKHWGPWESRVSEQGIGDVDYGGGQFDIFAEKLRGVLAGAGIEVRRILPASPGWRLTCVVVPQDQRLSAVEQLERAGFRLGTHANVYGTDEALIYVWTERGVEIPSECLLEQMSAEEQAKVFVVRDPSGVRGGTAELSKVDNDLVSKYVGRPVSGTWYFFNRLFVPTQLRGQGVGSELMQQVVDWADSASVSIVNPVNPYGDLTMEDLVKFYRKYGFVVAREEDGSYLLVREARGSVENIVGESGGELLEQMSAEEQDAEVEGMLRRYLSEPTNLWLYTDIPIEDRMALAYLAADEMMGAAYKGDQVRQFVEAVKAVIAKKDDFWDQVRAKDSVRHDYMRSYEWNIEVVPLDRVGVYPKFGGFPEEWSHGSVVDTARDLSAGTENPEKRHQVLSMVDQWMTIVKFLPPILFPGGTYRGRHPETYEQMDWDIDDGNHRLVAAAISGAREAVCFVGRPRGVEEVVERLTSEQAQGGIDFGREPDFASGDRAIVDPEGLGDWRSGTVRDATWDEEERKFWYFVELDDGHWTEVSGESIREIHNAS